MSNAPTTDSENSENSQKKIKPKFHLGRINRLILLKKDSKYALFSDSFHSLNTLKVPLYELGEDLAKNIKVGEYLSLFIYRSKDNYLKATLKAPPALIGELATVIIDKIDDDKVTANWADNRWHEQLSIPRENLNFRPKKNQKVVVEIILDPDTEQLSANAKFDEISEKYDRAYSKIDQHVFIRTIDITEKQITVLVDDQYLGLLDFKSLPIQPEIGDMNFGKIVGYTEDHTMLIVQMQANIKNIVEQVQEQILTELKHPRAAGMIPFHDKTSSELILSHFGVSKKVFKKAVGGLLKANKIKLTDRSIVRF